MEVAMNRLDMGHILADRTVSGNQQLQSSFESGVSTGALVLGAIATSLCDSAESLLRECFSYMIAADHTSTSNKALAIRKIAGGVRTGWLTDRYDIIRQIGHGASG